MKASDGILAPIKNKVYLSEYKRIEKVHSEEAKTRGIDKDDYGIKFIVDSIQYILDDASGISRFFIRGGEFPATFFSNRDISDVLEKVPKETIDTKRIGMFGGAYVCIGSVDENGKFTPSNFMRIILQKNIVYRIRKEIDIEETAYDSEKRVIKHPFTEPHFRLLLIESKKEYRCLSHHHMPTTDNRVYFTPNYDSEEPLIPIYRNKIRSLLPLQVDKIKSGLSEREYIKFFMKKSKEVLDSETPPPSHIDFKSFLMQYNNTEEESQKKKLNEHFIVDLGDKTYDLAGEDHINAFINSVSGYLE